ncbi:MAG: hypothetical protein WAN75_24615 [Xanthobacteraceae bacterium]|jgi:hypothetical protein
MYWYGWMLTSLIGAGVLGWIAIALPEQWYLILYMVALFIYDKATVELEFLKSRWLTVTVALVVAAAVSVFAPVR